MDRLAQLMQQLCFIHALPVSKEEAEGSSLYPLCDWDAMRRDSLFTEYIQQVGDLQKV